MVAEIPLGMRWEVEPHSSILCPRNEHSCKLRDIPLKSVPERFVVHSVIHMVDDDPVGDDVVPWDLVRQVVPNLVSELGGRVADPSDDGFPASRSMRSAS